MAERTSTLYWGDCVRVAGRKISKSLLDELTPTLVNLTNAYIWDKYDWRMSISTLPSFYCVPNQQTYGAPANIIPTDFYGLRTAQLVRTDNVPPLTFNLTIVKDIQPTFIRFLPSSICYDQATQAFRLWPRFPSNIGCPTYMITGTYKIRPPKIAANAIDSTLLPFDDMFFEMFTETMKYVAYTLDNDPRAGQISAVNGQINATGQAAVAKGLIDWAASCEGLEMGEPEISPQEALVVTGTWTSDPFGIGFFTY